MMGAAHMSLTISEGKKATCWSVLPPFLFVV